MLEKYKKQNFEQLSSVEVSRDLIRVFERRRTIRQFDTQIPDREIVENAIDVARLAPSGANKQPWNFALISNAEMKADIRQLAEREEKRFYQQSGNEAWKEDLKQLHTSDDKSFLAQAPYLIVIFYRHFDTENGKRAGTNYYAKESVGIATGMLISALHMAGLSTLTYTPSRMNFLTKLFDRPSEERAFMVLGVGLPHNDVQVPIISKKSLETVLKTYL